MINLRQTVTGEEFAYFEERVTAALADSYMTPEHVFKLLELESYLVVSDPQAEVEKGFEFVIIEWIWEGDTKGLHVVIADYPIDQAAQWFDILDRVAEFNGCKFMTCNGRMGWEKVFKKFGAVKTGTILRRRL